MRIVPATLRRSAPRQESPGQPLQARLPAAKFALQVGSAIALFCGVDCGGDQPSNSHHDPDAGVAGNAGASADAGASGSVGMGGSSDSGASGGSSGSAGADGGSAGEQLLPDEPDNGTHGGSRLKAEWYDFAGTRVFADFYDTALETPCTPGPWTDGKVYCIPVSTANTGYTTKTCTDMLGEVSYNAACTAPTPGYLVQSSDSSLCGAASAHIYRLSATPTTLMEYYALQNGGCSGPFSTGYGNSLTYPVTGEVLPSELVEFTRESLADPGRLSRQYMVTADGARFSISPHDRDLDADCTLKPTPADRSTGSCPPTDTKDIAYYADMDCTQPEVAGYTACKKPAFARTLVDRSCAQGASNYYKVGDAVQVSSVFVGSSTICRATSLSSTDSLYAIGDAVTVQPLTREYDNVSGRNLQLIHFSDGTKRFRDQLLYDTAHDVECQVNVLDDGTIVCVPFGSSASSYYRDDTCTSFITIALVYFGADHCDQQKLPPFVINPGVASTGCGAGYEIRERGAQFTGTPHLKGDTCIPYSGLEPFHYYELGAVRPFSEFPTATKVRDQ